MVGGGTEKSRREESGSEMDEEGSGVGGMQHYVFDGNKKGKWLIDSTNKGNVRVRRPQTARRPLEMHGARVWVARARALGRRGLAFPRAASWHSHSP